MVSEATIVSYREASLLDLHLARLTAFLGIQCRIMCVGEGDSFGKLIACRESSPCVMASARSLAAIFHDAAIPPDVVARLFEGVPFGLLYGVTPDEQETSAVRDLTNGMVSSVVGFDRSDHLYQVSSTEPEITNEFSGLTFGPIHKENDCGLVVD